MRGHENQAITVVNTLKCVGEVEFVTGQPERQASQAYLYSFISKDLNAICERTYNQFTLMLSFLQFISIFSRVNYKLKETNQYTMTETTKVGDKV